MKKIWFLIILPVLFTGCAFTVSKTPLNYSYSGGAVSLPSSANIEIAQFTDKRDVTDGRVIFQKMDGYGDITSGAYEAEKPIVDIIRDSIINNFQGAGATVNSSAAKVRLEGELISNDFQVITSLFGSGKEIGTITMKFRLLDSHTGQLLWQDTIFGKDSEQALWITTDLKLKMVKGSIDNLIYTLINDKSFQQQLK